MIHLLIIHLLFQLTSSDPLILTTKQKPEVIILDTSESSNLGLSSQRETPSNTQSGECSISSGSKQKTQSGYLIKLPFHVDVQEGELDINIVHWQANTNKTKKWIERGDLIKIADGHVIQTSRSKWHTLHTISLMHGYTHASSTNSEIYLVKQGNGLSFEPEQTDPSALSPSSSSSTSKIESHAVAAVHAFEGERDEVSYLTIGTTLHGLLRPQMIFYDEHLQFLSRSMELSVLHGPLVVQAAGHLKFKTRKDIILKAGTGSKETETPRGSIVLSSNAVKGIRLFTENEDSEKQTGAISIKTGSTTSPQSSPGNIELVVGSAGIGSKGSSVTIRAGNVTGDSGIGGTLRLYGGDASGNFQDMENNNAIGGETIVSSGSGLTKSGDVSLLSGDSQFKSGTITIQTGDAGRGESGNIVIQTADAYTSGNITLSVGNAKLNHPGQIYLDGTIVIKEIGNIGNGDRNENDNENGKKNTYILQDKIQKLENAIERQEKMIQGLLKVMEKFQVDEEIAELQNLVKEMKGENVNRELATKIMLEKRMKKEKQEKKDKMVKEKAVEEKLKKVKKEKKENKEKEKKEKKEKEKKEKVKKENALKEKLLREKAEKLKAEKLIAEKLKAEKLTAEKLKTEKQKLAKEIEENKKIKKEKKGQEKETKHKAAADTTEKESKDKVAPAKVVAEQGEKNQTMTKNKTNTAAKEKATATITPPKATPPITKTVKNIENLKKEVAIKTSKEAKKTQATKEAKETKEAEEAEEAIKEAEEAMKELEKKEIVNKKTVKVTAVNCLKLAVEKFGEKVTEKRRKMQRGSWRHVPSGCTVYSSGDFAAHWNDLPGSKGSEKNDFTKV